MMKICVVLEQNVAAKRDKSVLRRKARLLFEMAGDRMGDLFRPYAMLISVMKNFVRELVEFE